ncbi:MAG: hypothetical protein DWQ31_19460 [Planctomycetota bacterium]|nr:MAG: hypothetical protein DWQ31_19460 [Planctomycetota bacterium]REJ93285.1 MAG: hypothetical protein DWQ35_10620 [Planctomycetota bacterium]REK30198.1 MAG: hypothetical protein DWQ42_02135 [Planctomycetota bacterium]REK49264.1 MAG: hypothetical protein DWQ46_00630 [Planctomycetota bacterium]
MRRRSDQESETGEHDSFLDIVANIVGILVILVVVVTARAGRAPTVSIAGPQPLDDELNRAQRMASSLEGDVIELDRAAGQLERELEARRRERDYMLTLAAAAEELMRREREQLAGADQIAYDLRNQLAARQAQLARANETLANVKPPQNVVQLESLPTPLSKTVYGEELHFRLLGGRIAYLPVDELFEEVRGEGGARVWKLDGELSEVTETAGPLHGFRMRYTMERTEIPVAQRVKTGRTGFIVRLREFEMIPVGSQLGEPLEAALRPGGQFAYRIGQLDPQRTTITLWVYPDSFGTFRELKKELFRRGFATAGRPLPAGVLVGGSPQGTRSQAE